MTSARILETESEVVASYAVMKQLRPHLSEGDYVDRVRTMTDRHGYVLAGLFVGARIVSVAGFRLSVCLHYGPFVYVDDLVTDAETRSQGYGGLLLRWVADYARERGYPTMRLDSGVQRKDAHRFYFREHFSIQNFHFIQDSMT